MSSATFGAERRLSVESLDAMRRPAGVTLLHYDKEYDRIADITGQPTRWLAPMGSLR